MTEGNAGTTLVRSRDGRMLAGGVTGFRPFFNPATGEWIEYTALAEDTGGELVRFSWRSMPGGAAPPR